MNVPLGGKFQKEHEMVKTGFCSIALAVVLMPLAQPVGAQNWAGTPKPAIRDYGPFNGHSNSPINTTTKVATGKCGNPAGECLFYGGDFLFDPLYPSSLPNALANENTLLIPGTPYGAATWVPFVVPAGQAWAVTGLFTNNLAEYGVLDQGVEPTSVAYWSINQEVFAGNAGTVIASGTSPATSTPTGRSAFDDTEYTIQVTGLSLVLTPGTYWMAVVPICSNPANPYCDGIFFESDVEYLNTTPTNAFGPAEPVDASFFDSSAFGISFEPTYGPVGACGGFGCDAFSVGVLGKKVSK
jgi:hypothetical protein